MKPIGVGDQYQPVTVSFQCAYESGDAFIFNKNIIPNQFKTTVVDGIKVKILFQLMIQIEDRHTPLVA